MPGQIPQSCIQWSGWPDVERHLSWNIEEVWNWVHRNRNRQRPYSLFDTEYTNDECEQDNSDDQKHYSQRNIQTSSRGKTTTLGEGSSGRKATMSIQLVVMAMKILSRPMFSHRANWMNTRKFTHNSWSCFNTSELCCEVVYFLNMGVNFNSPNVLHGLPCIVDFYWPIKDSWFTYKSFGKIWFYIAQID